MIEAIEILSKGWPIVLSCIGLVAWLVRLEARAGFQAIKLAELQGAYNAMNSEVMKKISEMSDKLSRIEGRMDSHK